jgi:hypothetical protein
MVGLCVVSDLPACDEARLAGVGVRHADVAEVGVLHAAQARVDTQLRFGQAAGGDPGNDERALSRPPGSASVDTTGGSADNRGSEEKTLARGAGPAAGCNELRWTIEEPRHLPGAA